MRLDGHGNVQVAGRSAVDAVLAFVGQSQPHARFDASRNVHGQGPLPVDTLTALAGAAGFRDDVTAAVALAAWAADAEEALLESELPGTLATGADFDRGSRPGAAAFAFRTDLPPWNLELGFLPVDRFFEGQLQIVLEIRSAFGSRPPARAAEEIFENVVEDVAEAAAAEVEALESAGTLLRAGMAEHVVTPAFLLVAEDFVGFVDLFESFFCGFFLLFGGLEIGMVLARQPAVGLLDVLLGSVSIDSERLVIIAFGHGSHNFLCRTKTEFRAGGTRSSLRRIVPYFFSLSTSSNSASTTLSSVLPWAPPFPRVPLGPAPAAADAFLYISSASLCDALVSACIADSMAATSLPSIALRTAAIASLILFLSSSPILSPCSVRFFSVL